MSERLRVCVCGALYALPATPPPSGDVEAARKALLDIPATAVAWRGAAFRAALDAFEAAIRAESDGLDADTVAATIWALDHINPSDAWVRDFIAAYERARLAEDADKP